MAHVINDKGEVRVDWETGDSEKDRAYLFKAYWAFLKEIRKICEEAGKDSTNAIGIANKIEQLFKDWKVKRLREDSFPRIQVKYPEGYNIEGED